ncbi:FAD-binding protein [bacterium]|nr:FAD-binding protein [bacterium]
MTGSDSVRNSGTAAMESSLSGTIDAERAATRHWDVIVIGAGPAGAMAAVMLARQGLATLLIEARQFPRYKVCGACLNPRTLATLRSAGLEIVVRDAVPLDRFQLRVGGRLLDLDLPGSAALSRNRFDTELVQAAIEAGAEFLPGCRAKVLRHLADGAAGVSFASAASTDSGEIFVCGEFREVILNDGSVPRLARAAVVLACDGLAHSSLVQLDNVKSHIIPSSRIGVGFVLPEASSEFAAGSIHMAVGRGGYVGLVRIEDQQLNVAAALNVEFVRESGSVAAALQQTLDSAGFPAIPALAEAEIHGTPALTRQTVPLAAHRLLLLGDASGYVEPFTGEGIAWALALARSVPTVVAPGIGVWSRRVELSWQQTWRREVGRHQLWCRRLAWLLRRPTVVNIAMLAATACPQLISPIVRRLNRVPVQSDATFAVGSPAAAGLPAVSATRSALRS